MESFKRNAVGITLLIILALAVIAVVVVTAVDANKIEESNVYFIDGAPIDYNATENVVYVKRFRDAVSNYFSSVSSQINLNRFADRLLNALSVSRVSVSKLDTLATAINKYELNEIFAGVGEGEITEEWLTEILSKTSMDLFGSFFRRFFKETGLTSEELGLFIYNYLNIYGGDGYKTALNAVGKNNFIDLLSFTTFFLSSYGDTENGSLSETGAMEAALYQMGAVLKNAAAGGVENLEKALGLVWIYGNDKDNYEEINAYSVALNGKIGYIFPLFGCILKEIDAETVRIVSDKEESGDKYIRSRILVAKTVNRGLEKFIAEYGDKFGAKDKAELTAQIKLIFSNLYGTVVASSDGDRERFDALVNETYGRIDRFIAALEALNDCDDDFDYICNLTAEEKEKLTLFSKDLAVLKGDADTFLAATFYSWSMARLYEIAREVQ